MNNYDPEFLEKVSMPAFLGFARRSYGWAMREALKEVGCEDIPRRGLFVIGAIARNGSQNREIVQSIGMSKQAASQLMDTLVLRGYVVRTPDPSDRRRMKIELTERGKVAAEAMKTAVDKMDAQLLEAVGAEYIQHTKITLATIIDMNEARHKLTSADE